MLSTRAFPLTLISLQNFSSFGYIMWNIITEQETHFQKLETCVHFNLVLQFQCSTILNLNPHFMEILWVFT